MPIPWNAPEVVARFAVSPPNEVLMKFAATQQPSGKLLDIGCGAGCNAVPLAQAGWDVTGLDLSEPMIEAANRRAVEGNLTDHLRFECAPMDQLPVVGKTYDFIVAHGIWNLAGSGKEFRAAVREAARAAKPGAPLFVFTFSRTTLPETCAPVEGETFVFTEFSGRPQCFLTEKQLIEELADAGFEQEPGQPISEYPRKERIPALLEGIFRRKS
jgi:2-polyprenyl-3-methyl-5-hydroxy-6-metoxy-1,4-benzoquinol methylase